MITVRLSKAEMLMASSVGAMRQISSLAAGRDDAHGAAGNGWQMHIEGAMGELAAAKAMGRFWSGTINSFGGADMGARIQVRTRSRHDYDLIVRDNDQDDHLFILVTGEAPEYRVRGWISGSESKRDCWRKSPNGRPEAWFVPASALHPLVTMDETV